MHVNTTSPNNSKLSPCPRGTVTFIKIINSQRLHHNKHIIQYSSQFHRSVFQKKFFPSFVDRMLTLVYNFFPRNYNFPISFLILLHNEKYALLSNKMKDFCQVCDFIAFFKFRNFERYSCSTENFKNCFQQLDAKITLKQFLNVIKCCPQYLQITKNNCNSSRYNLCQRMITFLPYLY